MIQLAHGLSSLPGWHTTLYDPDAVSSDVGPGLNITWPGHNVSAWPDKGSTPSGAEQVLEGEAWHSAGLLLLACMLQRQAAGIKCACIVDSRSCPYCQHALHAGPTSLDNAALSKRWPLCLDLAPYCGKGGDLLAAIAASMLQANGTAQVGHAQTEFDCCSICAVDAPN